MELGQYARAVRHYWLLEVAILLIALIASSTYLLLRAPTYVSTAKVFVSAGGAANVNDLSQAAAFSQNEATSYAAIASTPYILQPVVDALHLRITADALASRVSAAAEPNAQVLDINVSASSPVVAAKVANSIAERLQYVTPRLSLNETGSGAKVILTVVQPGSTSSRPSSPNVGVVLLLTIVGSAILAVVTALAVDFIRTAKRRLLSGTEDASQEPDTSSPGDRG